MRSIIRTSTNSIVTGARQDRLVVSGTVDMRAKGNRRMRILYQHANQALARFLATVERCLKPALALAPATAGALTSSAAPHANSASHAAPAAPRCWQRKAAGQHSSARQSRG